MGRARGSRLRLGCGSQNTNAQTSLHKHVNKCHYIPHVGKLSQGVEKIRGPCQVTDRAKEWAAPGGLAAQGSLTAPRWWLERARSGPRHAGEPYHRNGLGQRRGLSSEVLSVWTRSLSLKSIRWRSKHLGGVPVIFVAPGVICMNCKILMNLDEIH